LESVSVVVVPGWRVEIGERSEEREEGQERGE
jgi:hypothetical protein